MNGPSKHILLVHGRGAKPAAEHLHGLWLDALKRGLQRDAPEAVDALEQADVKMIYYADRLAGFAEPGYDEALDLSNRQQNLDALATRRKAREFRRRYYEELPGKTPLKEFLMDFSVSVGAGGLAWRKALPELEHYLSDAQRWASGVRDQLKSSVASVLEAEGDLMIISHCMGSIITWDALWELSQETAAPRHRVNRWITIGSPLGASSVQRKLRGAASKGKDRYPALLNTWYNIAAEDDYVSHDKTVSDDFRAMLQQRLIGDIQDHTIYNLSVRYGRSNPHSSAGYLIHPRTTKILHDWLTS